MCVFLCSFNLILLSLKILPVDLETHNLLLHSWPNERTLRHHQPCVIFVHYTQALPLEFLKVLNFTVWKTLP